MMVSLERYRAFIEIIDRGSLTAAARHLDVSLQSISRSLSTLEREFGVELIRRTTRRLQPTPAGLAFHARVKAALTEIELARAEIGRESARVAGTLRIGASVLFAPKHVVPAAAAFLARHPQVEIELVLSDGIADLVEDRLDLAIRIGDPGPPHLKMRPLGQLRRGVVASPAYLARRGLPQTPEDLAEHDCVVRTFGPEGDAWPLTIDGTVARIPVRGVFRCNDAASANAAVVAGAGLGLAPLWQIQEDLDQGCLKVVLSAFEPPPVPVQAVWPGAAGTPVRTRLFVETLALRLGSEGARL
ncbi:LysR family transcriptional regulator [Methylobacterium sp. J-072]|uniref:LysR family transcriptional regulator n=1 Tax=Methylobacterium sp. J-072 TaxID=2836651 RepID=UPI001FBA0CF0|nr:LysR family transcriptional regulator [Methylobacterium sp. J-072]MCJ2097049.1 LysR family transcriptional regulator [Methylobacterium sp. J-072]